MRIAFVSPFITSYFDPAGDCYGSQQLNLAKGLVAGGHDVEIVSGFRTGCVGLSPPDGVKVTWLRMPRLRNTPLVFLWGLEDLLRKGSFDVVLTTESYSPVSLQAVHAHAGVVLYHGFTGTKGSRSARWGARFLKVFFERAVVKRVRGAIAKTPEAEDYLRGMGLSRVQTVPVGVDTELFRPLGEEARAEVRSKWGLPDGILLIYVGNLLPRRDLATILSAFRKACNERKDIHLLVVGDGPERGALTRFMDTSEYRGSVTWIRKVPHRALAELYAMADRFIFASRYEVFGMVLLESLASGTPIVSTPVPAATMLADHENGIELFDYGDAVHLAAMMVEAPALEKRAGARRGAEAYSWTCISRRVEQALLSLV
jgi:glycosyltransferase involved in cell wall biosynthesis